jgi:hypothetical protein
MRSHPLCATPPQELLMCVQDVICDYSVHGMALHSPRLRLGDRRSDVQTKRSRHPKSMSDDGQRSHSAARTRAARAHARTLRIHTTVGAPNFSQQARPSEEQKEWVVEVGLSHTKKSTREKPPSVNSVTIRLFNSLPPFSARLDPF